MTSGCYGSAPVLERTDGGSDDAEDSGDSGSTVPDVDAALPMDCPAGTITSRAPLPPTPALEIHATGAILYDHAVSSATFAEDPIETTARLDSVDTASPTLHFTSAEGGIDVLVMPVDTTVLAALPIARDVTVRFADGVTITDASDGSLLFAALSVRRTGTIDAGPIHVAQGIDRCLGGVGWDTTFTCAWGLTSTEVDVHAEGHDAVLTFDAPSTTIAIGTETLSITMLRSERSMTSEQIAARYSAGHCALGLVEELAVVIGPS